MQNAINRLAQLLIQDFPDAAFFLASEISFSARASFSISTARAFNRPRGVFDHLQIIHELMSDCL
jgi:hypothetical protein